LADPGGKKWFSSALLGKLKKETLETAAPYFSTPFSFEQVGVHEKHLRNYFKEFNYTSDSKPLNRPISILLFTNRSGSTIIGEYLRATHRFTGFGEPLNYKLVIKRSEREQIRTFPDYLSWELEKFQLRDCMFGMKASYNQAMMLVRSGALSHYFTDVRWVIVQRDDILAQAVSFSIAAQTEQWTSNKRDKAHKVVYDYKDIEKRIKALSVAYGAMNTFCAVMGISPYRVRYEDFVANPKQGAERLAAYLGSDNIEFDESRLKMRKQSNSLSSEFKLKFLADYRASLPFTEAR